MDIVYAHPDDHRVIVGACLAAGARGLVLAGAGTASIIQRLLPAIQEAVSQGAEVRVSRSSLGLVGRNMEFNDDMHGTLAGDTLNPSKARMLLMLALTRSSKRAFIQTSFDIY